MHEKVNVIPLIAKADTLTPEECQRFKKQVGASGAGLPGSAVARRTSCCVGHKNLKMLDLSVQIMREIQEHKIKIYEFPETGDEEENRLVRKIKVRSPPANARS